MKKIIYATMSINQIQPKVALSSKGEEKSKEAIEMIARGVYELHAPDKIIIEYKSWEDAYYQVQFARNTYGTVVPVKLEINIIRELQEKRIKTLSRMLDSPYHAILATEESSTFLVSMKLLEVGRFLFYNTITEFKEPIPITVLTIRDNIKLYKVQLKKIIDDTEEVRLPKNLKNMIFEYTVKLPQDAVPPSVRNSNSC